MSNDSYDALHDGNNVYRWSRHDAIPAARHNFRRPTSTSGDGNDVNRRQRDVRGQHSVGRRGGYSSNPSTSDGCTSRRPSSFSKYDRFQADSDRECVAFGRNEEKRYFRDESRAKNAPKEKHFGYRYLEAQLRKDTPSIILEVLKPNSPFDTYLDKTELQADWLFMIMRILKLICETEYKGNKAELLNKVAKSNLLHAIQFYLSEACFEKNEATISNMASFIVDLITFYGTVIDVLPSVALEKDLIRIIMKSKIAVDQIRNHLPCVIIDQNIVDKMDDMKAKVEDYEKALEKQAPSSRLKRTRIERLANSTPPENFRYAK